MIEFRAFWHDWINRADQMDALDTVLEARRPQDQQIIMLSRELSDRLDLTSSSRECTPNTSACD
ncbi:hypothetical protein DZK27_14775 [Rhodobacteraceae bacterium 63075]|nr:hypothetical protein DZK27_14775 [Rhodobacteraceae bacterium 63075]